MLRAPAPLPPPPACLWSSREQAEPAVAEPGSAGAGAIAFDGRIECGCTKCRGKAVSCSEFEEHAGSRERRPGECIFLTAAEVSLKDLCLAINDDGGAALHRHQQPATCAVCWHEGRLVTCASCGTAVHPPCAGLSKAPEVHPLSIEADCQDLGAWQQERWRAAPLQDLHRVRQLA